jgi:hypothetical protein
MNDVERQLADHARRWAAQAPPVPSLDAAVAQVVSSRRRRGLWPAFAVAACVVALALVAGLPGLRSFDDNRVLPIAANSTAASSAADELSPAVRARLWPLVVNAAKVDGDPGSAATGEVVRSTRGKAEALFGDASDDPEPVWVVQIRGALVCSSCLGPDGTDLPSGKYAVLILSDSPGLRNGQAFADRPYDLSELGHVYKLTPPPAGTPTHASPSPSSATVAAPGGPGIAGEEQSLLWKLASSASTDNGGDGLPSVDMVRTTYQAAADFLSVSGSGPDPDTPVWLVQVHGSFVCHDCTSSTGATGSVLTIVVGNLGQGAVTKYGVAGTIYEFGVADHAYDLSSFGEVLGMVP